MLGKATGRNLSGVHYSRTQSFGCETRGRLSPGEDKGKGKGKGKDQGKGKDKGKGKGKGKGKDKGKERSYGNEGGAHVELAVVAACCDGYERRDVQDIPAIKAKLKAGRGFPKSPLSQSLKLTITSDRKTTFLASAQQRPLL